MNKFFIQKIQLSDKEIINGVEHWNEFQIGKPGQLKITDTGSKIVIKYSDSSSKPPIEDVLMTIPDSEEFRILRALVNAGYESALECYFCELDTDKNFMKNPPKVAVFLKSILQDKKNDFNKLW